MRFRERGDLRCLLRSFQQRRGAIVFTFTRPKLQTSEIKVSEIVNSETRKYVRKGTVEEVRTS